MEQIKRRQNKRGMIYEVSPYASDKRYGHALNEHIRCFPDDAWIVVRDRDTMWFPGSGAILERAILDRPDTNLFTCNTNRPGHSKLAEEKDMMVHYAVSQDLKDKPEYLQLPDTAILPGFFWMFPKRLWLDHPFDGLPILADGGSFDVRWTRGIIDKVRIQHLYIYHWYRLHKSEWSVNHLL